MDAKGVQMEVRGRRRTRAPLAECNGNMMIRGDRSRSPIKFSGKADDAKEVLPVTPNKDSMSDATAEDINMSPISSYVSTDTTDTEQETDSFCCKMKARFIDSGEPLDFSGTRPSDPMVLGSSFLQNNPEFTFAEGAQLTSTPKQPDPRDTTQVYYTKSGVVTITPMNAGSCEMDSGLGTSTDSPQSQQPLLEAGSVLERALEGIFGEQGENSNEKNEEQKEEEKIDQESVSDEENSIIDVIQQPEVLEQNNGIMIINDHQVEEAPAPVNIPPVGLEDLIPGRVPPAPLLDNVQWYYKRPGMKVREALADAGVCATEVLMDELRFRPSIYHQRSNSWHSKNVMSAGGIREVLLRLGVDDSSTQAYKTIFNNLQSFTGTYIFLRHSLDHGDFPPELEFLQEEAMKVRHGGRDFNPERTQCLRINKDFNEVVLQRAVRAARQFGALAQRMEQGNRVGGFAPTNGNANPVQAARQVDGGNSSDSD